MQKLSEGLDIHLGAEAWCGNQLYHYTQNKNSTNTLNTLNTRIEVKSISLEDEVSVQTTQENYRGAEISPQSQSRQSPEPSEPLGSAVIVTTPLAILQAERLKFFPKMSPEWHAAWRITLD